MQLHSLTLQWRYNRHDGVSNPRPHHCLLNRLLRCRSKKTSKLPITGPLCGKFIGDRWIPRTKGQQRGKCFHLMTSSWSVFKHSVRTRPIYPCKYPAPCVAESLSSTMNGFNYVRHFCMTNNWKCKYMFYVSLKYFITYRIKHVRCHLANKYTRLFISTSNVTYVLKYLP